MPLLLIASFVAGFVLVVTTANDIFQSVIIPRPIDVRYRPSGLIIRAAWQTFKRITARFSDGSKREEVLGAFGPMVLVGLLVYWVSLLTAGYGLIFFALRDQIKPVPSLIDAMYFSGASFLTIGYGDFVPAGIGARLVALLAAASGLGSFAIITAFLFAIFGSYQQREAFVVTFTNRAGAPPSGLNLVAWHTEIGMRDGMLALLRDGEIWLSQVLETHLAYPILTYFRSSHDDISWIAVIGAILDASTLVATTIDIPRKGQALVSGKLGSHFIRDFASYFNLPGGDAVGIDRSEFDAGYERLAALGVPLVERERAWAEFSRIRATYANQLNLIALYWEIPPAQWIGDRSFISTTRSGH